MKKSTAWWSDAETPVAPYDVKAFRGACYSAARATGGKVVEFVCETYVPNFDGCVLAYQRPERSVAVVVSREMPVLAVTTTAPERNRWDELSFSSRLDFVDFPELSEALAQALPFRVATVAELNEPFNHNSKADLALFPVYYQGDIRYWRPHTIGEVLFNHWD